MCDIFKLIVPPLLLAERRGLKSFMLLWEKGHETADPHACIDRRAFQANIAESPNAVLMLGQRHRRRSNIKTALG